MSDKWIITPRLRSLSKTKWFWELLFDSRSLHEKFEGARICPICKIMLFRHTKGECREPICTVCHKIIWGDLYLRRWCVYWGITMSDWLDLGCPETSALVEKRV